MLKVQEARISQFLFKFEGANYSKLKIEFFQDGMVMKYVNDLEGT